MSGLSTDQERLAVQAALAELLTADNASNVSVGKLIGVSGEAIRKAVKDGNAFHVCRRVVVDHDPSGARADLPREWGTNDPRTEFDTATTTRTCATTTSVASWVSVQGTPPADPRPP